MSSHTDERDWVDIATAEASETSTLEGSASDRSVGTSDGAMSEQTHTSGQEEPPARVPLSDTGSDQINNVEGYNEEVAEHVSGEGALRTNADSPKAEPVLEPMGDNTATEGLDSDWSQTECHMNDIRHAQMEQPKVPMRTRHLSYKLLVTGQPETGRSTAIRNLFASIACDPAWQPTDVTALTAVDFERNPAAFETVISGVKDTRDRYDITYTLQETPGLRGEPAACAEMLASYIQEQQVAYAAQERDISKARDNLQDSRVDAVLYFLPNNARISESELDRAVITRLADFVPVIPVMCKADCLEEAEVLRRKEEMAKLIRLGLPVFMFPESAVDSAANEHLCNSPTAAEKQSAAVEKPVFKLPFNVVAGSHTDGTVGKYWFVRKYKWAMCEAYRTANSDLKLLRQLLLEQGFWAIKDEAERRYRVRQGQVDLAGVPPLPSQSVDRSSQILTSAAHVDLANGSLQSPAPTASLPSDPFAASDMSFAGPAVFAAASSAPHAPGTETGPGDPFLASADPFQGRMAEQQEATPVWAPEEYKEVTVDSVQRSGSERKSFRLTLKVEGDAKVLCMRIGDAEGSALVSFMRDADITRPNSYDCSARLLEGLGCKLLRVLITECTSTVFYSQLQAINEATGATVSVDARPSDAINLAMRGNVRIYLHTKVVRQFAKRLT